MKTLPDGMRMIKKTNDAKNRKWVLMTLLVEPLPRVYLWAGRLIPDDQSSIQLPALEMFPE